MFGDGSASFLQFLQEELIPDIEANYRADPSQRPNGGTTHGRIFVLQLFNQSANLMFRIRINR